MIIDDIYNAIINPLYSQKPLLYIAILCDTDFTNFIMYVKGRRGISKCHVCQCQRMFSTFDEKSFISNLVKFTMTKTHFCNT